MLAEFLTWWRQHLLELVPESIRARAAGQGNALIVDGCNPGLLTLLRRRRGVESRIAQVRLDEPGLPTLRAAFNGRPAGEPVILRLNAATLLERRVTLPLAAERDPERVLAYDMERLTPFAVDEVYWGWSVEERDRARGRLILRLTFVPRIQVTDLIETLSACQGRPGLIEGQTSTGLRSIRLQHDQPAGPRALFTARNSAFVLAAVAALVVLSPFLRQSLDMQAAQSTLEALQPRIRVVDQLRRRIAGAGAGSQAVVNETRRLGDTLSALAIITQLLPDDSYLTEFTMRERKMTLSGMAASAPRLISLLSADQRVRNPAFTAPVTKADPSHLDVFSIRADLAQ